MGDMVGLDTNVLLRWVLQLDVDREQSARVHQFLAETTEDILLATPVLVEAVWTMRGRYRVERSVVVSMLRQMQAMPQVRFSDPESVHAATEAFAIHGGDFADHLIGALNRTAACTTTLTFDKKAARLETFTELT